MSGVDVVPADIVHATVKACKRACRSELIGEAFIPPAAWDLSYAAILEEAQVIADQRSTRPEE